MLSALFESHPMTTERYYAKPSSNAAPQRHQQICPHGRGYCRSDCGRCLCRYEHPTRPRFERTAEWASEARGGPDARERSRQGAGSTEMSGPAKQPLFAMGSSTASGAQSVALHRSSLEAQASNGPWAERTYWEAQRDHLPMALWERRSLPHCHDRSLSELAGP